MTRFRTDQQLTEKQVKALLRQKDLEEKSTLMQPIREAERPPFQIKKFKRNTLGLCGKRREVTESELARYIIEAEFSPPIGKPQEEAIPYIKGHCGIAYHYEDKAVYWRQSKDNSTRYIVTVDYIKKK